MKLDALLTSWSATKTENRLTRMVLLCLATLTLILGVMLSQKDEIIVIKPETLGTEAWLTRADSSQSYIEAWALFFAQLTGNITPQNVTFIKERIKPLLAPKIYNDVVDELERQAIAIREDRISMRFEPRSVEYEKESGKVFVYGESYTKGSGAAESSADRTYEYQIQIRNYAPVVNDIDTYTGRPKTILEIENAEKRRSKK
jgi:conjugal transfer pilus assembly protein TraE